jgi:hypothetical protein
MSGNWEKEKNILSRGINGKETASLQLLLPLWTE